MFFRLFNTVSEGREPFSFRALVHQDASSAETLLTPISCVLFILNAGRGGAWQTRHGGFERQIDEPLHLRRQAVGAPGRFDQVVH